MSRKCRVYNCLQTYGGCCADCNFKHCESRCLNSPDRCGVWESEEARARRKRRPKTTPEEIERMMELAQMGAPYKEIAEVIGCALSTVQYHLNRLGYRRHESEVKDE